MNEEFKIKVIPVRELEGFDPKAFSVRPWDDHRIKWTKSCKISKQLFEECKKAAMQINEICIVELSNELGSFTIGESCSKGCSSKFILFNATKCGRESADIRAVTPNTGKGALTQYWYDQFFCFEKGSIG
jgi:hypothetical protein